MYINLYVRTDDIFIHEHGCPYMECVWHMACALLWLEVFHNGWRKMGKERTLDRSPRKEYGAIDIYDSLGPIK